MLDILWKKCLTAGDELLVWLVSLNNPKQFVSGIVFLLLLVGGAILLNKIFGLLLNWFALFRTRLRSDKWWRNQPSESKNEENRFQSYAAILLNQKPSPGVNQLRRPSSWMLWRGRLVQNYIYGLYSIRRANGTYERESLRDILEEKIDRWVEFPRYMAASFVLLGLLGTVIGLSRSMEKIVPLIKAKELTDLNSLRDIVGVLLGTIQSMEIALHTTLVGLVGTLVLSLLLVVYRQLEGSFLSRLEDFIHTNVIPGFFPQEQSQIRQHLESIDKSTEAMVGCLVMLEEMSVKGSQNAVSVTKDVREATAHLSRMEKVFDERFDEQLHTLNQLVGDTSRVIESLDSSGNSLMTFVISFQDSIDKQVSAVGRIQGAQEEFNQIIGSFREVLSEVRKESTQTLERVEVQQSHLEKLLSQQDDITTVFREEHTTLSKMREALNDQQQSSLLQLQEGMTVGLSKIEELYREEHKNLTECRTNLEEEQRTSLLELRAGLTDGLSNVEKLFQQEHETLTNLRSKLEEEQRVSLVQLSDALSEKLSKIEVLFATSANKFQGSLESHIPQAATTIVEHIRSVYEEAGASLNVINARATKLHELSEKVVNHIFEQRGELTNQLSSLKSQQDELQELYRSHERTLMQWSQDTTKSWQDNAESLQSYLSGQQILFEGIQSSLQQTSMSFDEHLPSMSAQQKEILGHFSQSLSQFQDLLAASSELRKVPEITSELVGLIQHSAQTSQVIHQSISALQTEGVVLQERERWSQVLEESLKNIREINYRISEYSHRRKGFFGWPR